MGAENSNQTDKPRFDKRVVLSKHKFPLIHKRFDPIEH